MSVFLLEVGKKRRKSGLSLSETHIFAVIEALSHLLACLASREQREACSRTSWMTLSPADRIRTEDYDPQSETLSGSSCLTAQCYWTTLGTSAVFGREKGEWPASRAPHHPLFPIPLHVTCPSIEMCCPDPTKPALLVGRGLNGTPCLLVFGRDASPPYAY